MGWSLGRVMGYGHATLGLATTGFLLTAYDGRNLYAARDIPLENGLRPAVGCAG